MAPTHKIAIIGHNGWAARSIVTALARRPFTQPIRILARESARIDTLPKSNIEVARCSWDNTTSIEKALTGVDVLLSFIGHEGLSQQHKLIQPLKKTGVKLFVPSDLALLYTDEERKDVEVPRTKHELEKELKKENVPFATILVGNFTSFALGSPFMGIDLEGWRVLHTGKSKENKMNLCSLDYVTAAYVDIFFNSTGSLEDLAGRTIGLSELVCSTGDIEEAMRQKEGKGPAVAYDSVENAAKLMSAGRLDALVRKKMGDGTHGVGNDIWDVKGFEKKRLVDFIAGDALGKPPYIEPNDSTRRFLDEYFK